MRSVASFQALLLVCLAVAGCVGGGDSAGPAGTDAAGPAGFDDQTGGIEGLVVDGEGLPVPGALVASLEADKSATTDSQGLFALSNLQPGPHTVAANKLGYSSVVVRVSVEAGRATTVQLTVDAIVVREAYHEMIPKAGFFECTWRHALGSGMCGYIGQTNDTTGNPLEDNVFTNSARKWNYPAGPGVMTVLNEMVWTAGSFATGDNLRIFFSYANRTATHTYCQADGYAPLAMKWEREDGDDDGDCESGDGGGLSENPTIDFEKGEVLQTFVSVGVLRVQGVSTSHGFAYQQHFDIWFSIFYWEPAPEDYSALPDA